MSTISPGRPQVKRHAWWHRRGTWGWDLASRSWWQLVRVRQEGPIPSLAGDPHGAHGPGHVQSSPLALRVQGCSGGCGVLYPPSPCHLLGFSCPQMPWPATLENPLSSGMPSFMLAQPGPPEGPGLGKASSTCSGLPHLDGPWTVPATGPRPCCHWCGQERKSWKASLASVVLRPGWVGSMSISEERPAPQPGRREATLLSLPWRVLSQPSQAHLLPEARPHPPSRVSTRLAP